MIGRIERRIAWAGLFVLVVLFGATGGHAQSKPGDPSWLVGYWQGRFSDPSNDKSNIFGIRIDTVDADGRFDGVWDTNGKNQAPAQGELDGDRVMLRFPNGNVTWLQRQPGDKLVGKTTLAKGGQTNEFVFAKAAGGCDFESFSTAGRNAIQATEHWHLDEGEKTKYFDKLYQHGVMVGSGSLTCRNGRLVKVD